MRHLLDRFVAWLLDDVLLGAITWLERQIRRVPDLKDRRKEDEDE